MDKTQILVVGGGPAGMMAAIAAAQNGAKVILLEKTDSLGNKLLLTGKGRCNLTNVRSVSEVVDKFGPGGKFLFGAFTRFSSKDLRQFFTDRGVATKVERGQRVFPVSNRAGTILKCLVQEMEHLKVNIVFNAPVIRLGRDQNGFIIKTPRGNFQAQKVILATGGMSYPHTGSSGDGYSFAKKFGHRVLPLKSGLNSLFVADQRVRQLAGLTLKNICLSLMVNNKAASSATGELLFTHQGLTGPVAYNLTIPVYDLTRQRSILASLDFKPTLSPEKLRKSLYQRIHAQEKQEVGTLLNSLLPASTIRLALSETGLNSHEKSGSLTPKQIDQIIGFLKNFTFLIKKTAPLSVAIVTAGGVDFRELNPQTMESKIIPGLYFAGELIGLCGPTGGFNLQKAFSSGWVAGKAAAN